MTELHLKVFMITLLRIYNEGIMAKNEIKIKEKKGKAGEIFFDLVLVFAVCVCLFAGGNLYQIFAEYKAGTDEYNSIQNTVVVEREAGIEEVTRISGDVPKKKWKAPIEVDFTKLKEINTDVCGWIYAEAIPEISYPIVQGKDNEYYLHRTYEKNDNFAGSIFIDCDNNSDFNNCNTIIYGHNMKNGSMFGQLSEFKNRETYQKSKYIWILTPEETYKYEIFSAYVTPIKTETYTLIKGPGEEQKAYAEKMRALSEIDTERKTFDIRDKIITLSTCTGNENTRYVVQAVQIVPG